MTVTNFPYGINTPFTTTAITAAEAAAGVTPTNYSYPPLNVLRYGATGNGSTDDTAAIQSAIDVAYTAGGGVVFVPAGEYVVTQLEVKAYVTLRGAFTAQGSEGAVLMQKTASNIDVIIFDQAVTNHASNTWLHWCGVENLRVQGNTANTGGRGIYVQAIMGEGFTLSHLLVRDMPDSGVVLGAGGTSPTIEDLHLFRNGRADQFHVDTVQTGAVAVGDTTVAIADGSTVVDGDWIGIRRDADGDAKARVHWTRVASGGGTNTLTFKCPLPETQAAIGNHVMFYKTTGAGLEIRADDTPVAANRGGYNGTDFRNIGGDDNRLALISFHDFDNASDILTIDHIKVELTENTVGSLKWDDARANYLHMNSDNVFMIDNCFGLINLRDIPTDISSGQSQANSLVKIVAQTGTNACPQIVLENVGVNANSTFFTNLIDCGGSASMAEQIPLDSSGNKKERQIVKCHFDGRAQFQGRSTGLCSLVTAFENMHTDLTLGGVAGPKIITQAGVPSASEAKGSISIDTTNAKLYIATDAVGTWVVVGTQT